MSDRPRVLLITRHFWPHGSVDSACYAYQLATALQRDGVDIEVLTPRFSSSWTDHLVVGEIPVHRPTTAPRSDWSISRYTRHLTAWLRQHASNFDVFLVDAIREEAMAAVEAARTLNCSTVLRCSGWGRERDTQWWQRHRGASRYASYGKLANAVVAKSAACARALVAAGFKAERIVRIDDGFSAQGGTTTAAKIAAREALSKANGDLFAEEDVPVVLCNSPMTRDGGIQLLVGSALPLITRYPALRLWMVGDGPYRDWIYQQLRGDGVRASIAMPGSFSDNHDLFAAADVFLQPDTIGLDYFLRTAVQQETPIVAVDHPSTRTVLTGHESEREGEAGHCVTWIPQATTKAATNSLRDVLDDLPTARANASRLRRLLQREQPQDKAIRAYRTLLHKLIKRPRSVSVEAAS